MIKTPILMTLLGALALSSTATAEPGPGKHFEKLDTNADGKISAEEFSTHQAARFQTADSDKNGKVTLAELKAARDKHAKDRFANRLSRLDQNQDGKISRDEAKQMSDDKFNRVDANSDGVLSQEELSNMRGKPHGHDKGKGKKHAPGARMWEHLDQDGDGAVTLAEMKSSAPFFARFDTNKDGFVTREEMGTRKGLKAKRHDRKRTE